MSPVKPFVRLLTVFSMSIMVAQPGFGMPGIPDPDRSEAFIAFPGPGEATLMVVPDGSGPLFTEARDPAGNVTDATITLYVRDDLGIPLANIPPEDIWLESSDLGMVPCIGGNTPDHDTDADGMTRWVNAPFATGTSEAPAIVRINGYRLTSNDGLPLKFNSPDISSDGIVNLTDVAILTQDYFGGYSFRCDFNFDGDLDLSDVAVFARHFGARCP
ncbi:MAG: hypothetical protein ABFS42_06270 [Candidatus Krumholzibacteriota bacterium]